MEVEPPTLAMKPIKLVSSSRWNQVTNGSLKDQCFISELSILSILLWRGSTRPDVHVDLHEICACIVVHVRLEVIPLFSFVLTCYKDRSPACDIFAEASKQAVPVLVPLQQDGVVVQEVSGKCVVNPMQKEYFVCYSVIVVTLGL